MPTYARLRGYGLTVVPFAPFVLRRIGDGRDDRVALDHREMRVIVDPRNYAPSDALAQVAEIGIERGSDAWEIDFSAFTVAWPNHYSLAWSELNGVPFELCGAGGSLDLAHKALTTRHRPRSR